MYVCIFCVRHKFIIITVQYNFWGEFSKKLYLKVEYLNKFINTHSQSYIFNCIPKVYIYKYIYIQNTYRYMEGLTLCQISHFYTNTVKIFLYI